MTIYKSTLPLNITSLTYIYDMNENTDGVSSQYLYSVAEAHPPGNINTTFTIVDEHGLIDDRGTIDLSIHSMSEPDLTRISSYTVTGQWYNPGTRVYSTQWPIDVEGYFKECGDWSNTVDNWLTEGLDKDQRLIDAFKPSIIPLPYQPLKYQPLNDHKIIVTNSGTGKSFLSYIVGGEPIIGATEASALGSYDQIRGRPVIKHGFLHGEGYPIFLDEINTIDQPLINKLLTYLDQGILTRGLKHRVHIKGTKTVILTGNPPRDEVGDSLAEFLRVVCTADEPERLGRRFGFLLIGDDYKRVRGEGDPRLRELVCDVVSTTVKQYRSKIKKLIDDQLSWIHSTETEIEKSIRDYSDAIPHPVASDFVRGQSYGIVKKLKTSAIRYIILEQLDRVPSSKVDFSDRDKVFKKLLAINEDSWSKLAKVKPDDLSPKAWALQLKKDTPSLKNRQIAKLVGVSHTSVNSWLRDAET